MYFFQGVEDAHLKNFAANHLEIPTMISSVLSYEETQKLKGLFPDSTLFTHQTPIPIENNYLQKETLGIDRLANAIAAYHKTKKACLIIDCGTCLKVDYIDQDGFYLGGSISPGLQMRFRSLTDFTGRLPLIEPREIELLNGRTTEESILSGVINGMKYEITGFVERYKEIDPELTIFLTGGDLGFFDRTIKSPIFVDENLTHYGLLLTLQYVNA
jgi:type III pantothenate kinase